MMETWIVVLGLVFGNPDSRLTGVAGDLIRVERVQVATEAQCQRAAREWVATNQNSTSGYARAFAACAGRAPETQP